MRVFAFGLGPGPKNVGIELDDGTRTVVTYRTYKHKYQQLLGGSLSEKVYASAAGFVQFDPRTREVNNKTVTDITIRAVGSQKLIQVTIWPELQLAAPVKKGDFVAVDGSFDTRTYQAQDGSTREAHQISPTSLVVVPGVARAEREVVQAAPATSGGADRQTVPF